MKLVNNSIALGSNKHITNIQLAYCIEKCYENILNIIKKGEEMEKKNYIINETISSECIIDLNNGLKVFIKNNEAPKLLCPKIKDINIIVSDKVVEVTFEDDSKEKSVCREPDVFSLEYAISICISKKIMGGSSVYNNAVKHGIKVYENKLQKEAADKAEQERIEKKRAKKLAYKERRAAKRTEEENQRKAREREEQIEIQTEAYLRAMKAMENSKVENTNKENN